MESRFPRLSLVAIGANTLMQSMQWFRLDMKFNTLSIADFLMASNTRNHCDFTCLYAHKYTNCTDTCIPTLRWIYIRDESFLIIVRMKRRRLDQQTRKNGKDKAIGFPIHRLLHMVAHVCRVHLSFWSNE